MPFPIKATGSLLVYRKSIKDKKERKSTAQTDSATARSADKNGDKDIMEIDDDDDEPDAS
jgi:hypothetical protein